MRRNWGYRHTLRICTIYFFSTASIFMPKRPSVTLYVGSTACLAVTYREIKLAGRPNMATLCYSEVRQMRLMT